MKHISIEAPQAEATGRVLLVEDDDKCSRLHSRWQPKQPSQDRNSEFYRHDRLVRAVTELFWTIALPAHVGSGNRRQASRVTTGYSVFVEGGDDRSAWARRWKDLILAHVADLGGPEDLSEAQISLIRRASA